MARVSKSITCVKKPPCGTHVHCAEIVLQGSFANPKTPTPVTALRYDIS